MSFPPFDAIRSRPWNSRRVALPGWTRNDPPMLTQEEMRMLAWIAAKTRSRARSSISAPSSAPSSAGAARISAMTRPSFRLWPPCPAAD
jgi:hypothetical protein